MINKTIQTAHTRNIDPSGTFFPSTFLFSTFGLMLPSTTTGPFHCTSAADDPHQATRSDIKAEQKQASCDERRCGRTEKCISLQKELSPPVQTQLRVTFMSFYSDGRGRSLT